MAPAIRPLVRAALWALAAALLPAGAAAKLESTTGGVRFTYRNPNAQAVFLTGDFNGWNPTAQPMAREGDTFATVVQLAPGDHEYKFVVDGQYFADPDNSATTGSYGNSLVRIGARGEIVAVEATSNTSLSPKILLEGRYIGLFVGRRDEANQDRFAVSRPDFNIDLDFKVRMSQALDARVLTKIRNGAEGTPLWETSLFFDRGSLDLHRPSFSLRVFDNDTAGTWGDTLRLVGDIGPYHHQFGFDQQGLRATGGWRGFTGTLLYADNFEAGDPQPPPLDTLAVGSAGLRYDFNLGDTNKNVLALRLERQLPPGLRLGAAMRLDRGYNPGSLSRVVVTSDTTRTRDAFGRTLERWVGGGLDVALGAPGDRWQAFGEILYGEASVGSGSGARQFFARSGSGFAPMREEVLDDQVFGVDTSQRWIVGGRLRAAADLQLRASVERERHGLGDVATDSLRYFRNAATTYRVGAEVDLRPRLGAAVRLGTDFELVAFSYPARAPWNTQLWFADRNFWMEHFEHRLLVGRYVQLGGEDATTWTPWAEWTLGTQRPLVVRGSASVFGTRIDRSPKLVESLLELTYPLTSRLRLYSDTRWARYNDPVLALHSGYVSTFVEASYTFAPGIAVALSYGVDPFVLDVVTNEYDRIGRNEFLVARGATTTVARDRYLNLGSILPRAEQALEDERRVQVEAIVRF